MKKRFSGKFRWLLVGTVALGVAIAGGATFYYTSSTQASTPTETPVQTVTAFRGNIVLYANGTGTLAPAKEASFGFGTSGQITELNAEIGDYVEAGQVIGQIDNTDVLAAYKQAKRNLDDLTTPGAMAEAKQVVAEADVAIYNAKQDLEYLISSDVYYWELQWQRKVAQAADRWLSPTAERKKIGMPQLHWRAQTISRAQPNMSMNMCLILHHTITDTEDTDGDGNTEKHM
jgi:multidrug efflux pump subunit AcrA (membrane-fusion protein)